MADQANRGDGERGKRGVGPATAEDKAQFIEKIPQVRTQRRQPGESAARGAPSHGQALDQPTEKGPQLIINSC